jgi:Flp pilus assembly protein TadD
MIPSILLAVLVFSTPGQRGGTGGQTQQQNQTGQGQRSGTGNQPSNTTQPSNQPSNNTTNTTNPVNPMPIFLMGNVMLSDGTPAPASVPVRILCGMTVLRSGAYTDSHGNFSIIIGQNGGQGGIAQIDSLPDSTFGSNSSNNGPNGLFGCEVKANLGGYISSSIPLDRHSSLDSPDVGTIYLHRIGEAGEGEGYTVSITTKLAPKDARKEYEKGLLSEKAKKWADAEQEFLKAVTIYPKYAIAWYELGRVFDQEKKTDDALHALHQAIQVEPKFVNPYSELSTIAIRQQKWPDVVKYTSDVIKLSAYTPPEIYFYNAAANYNLHELDAAEKSARVAARLDDKHKVPRINHLLGLILAQKQDIKGAVENLKLYLQLNPDATDAAAVQEQVAELEKAGGGQQ